MTALPPVAVFDADLPPGLAALRSLGSAGVDVTLYHPSRKPMGRYSRFGGSFRECPDVTDTDVFAHWLADEIRSGRIGLIAPTSDPLVFQTTSALAMLSEPVDVGHPPSPRLLDCLLKERFARSLKKVGFPTPPTAAPTSLSDARDVARDFGYPLVLKPRTHVGVGMARGAIVTNDDELALAFTQHDIGPGHETALAHSPKLTWPLMQKFIDLADLEVVSITGVLGRDGEVLALGHSTKERLWPRRLGVGTLFAASEPHPFTEHAVEAVSAVLGSGIFEFEVLFDRSTGEYWGIDLNPRMFGQIALDIARGNDLPRLWYESVTGVSLARSAAPSRPPKRWQMGVPLSADLLISSVGGPDRATALRQLRHIFGRSAVGAVTDWNDPLPALAFNSIFLRHPGSVIRPYLPESTRSENL